MIHDKKHLKYTAIPNEEMYWERVNRSLGWLGNTKQEQHNKQEKLKKCCNWNSRHWWNRRTTCTTVSSNRCSKSKIGRPRYI